MNFIILVRRPVMSDGTEFATVALGILSDRDAAERMADKLGRYPQYRDQDIEVVELLNMNGVSE